MREIKISGLVSAVVPGSIRLGETALAELVYGYG